MAVTQVEYWSADDVVLNTYAYNISSFDLSTPDPRGEHLTIPMANGVLPAYNRAFTAGRFSLNMWVLGCDEDGLLPSTRTQRRVQFDNNFYKLQRIFTRQDRPITIKKYRPGGGYWVECKALVDSSISYEFAAARQRGQFSVVLTVIDSFWTDSAELTFSTGSGAELPKTLTMPELAGTAPITDAYAAVTGPITNPVVTNPASGSWVKLNATVPSGSTWKIYSSTYTSVVDTTNAAASTVSGGTPQYLYIPPSDSGTGPPTLTLAGTAGGSTTRLSVQARRKWMTP